MNLAALSRKTAKAPSETLGAEENPFSTNKVTGYSLNFPIAGTCQPTKVCAKTCYFARGPSTWAPSLAKQVRLLNRLDSDPDGLAAQIARWASRLRLSFVRWHGGGDMSENSPRCIDLAAASTPGIPHWIVTRLPHLAAQVRPRPNVYVHLSVDRSSMDKVATFRVMAPKGLRWHWSYQCDRDEVPPPDIAPIVFRDCYQPLPGERPSWNDCPLNWTEDIAGVCEKCRRCFDGSATPRRKPR